ncbi:unnamed protein product [Rotaria sordida]|uniref:poly(ADP-ribose) glycohydrolase n=1 Tax=Rotaria sordida TaxID=392033 RepID=A0A815JY09_9BILA|nr:unnamed protein product [Rotaria sordida]CAF1385993.1 unnamed protein product [Rotaria sordida]
MVEQLNSIKLETDSCQRHQNFNENDIDQLNRKINRLQEKYKQLIGKDRSINTFVPTNCILLDEEKSSESESTSAVPKSKPASSIESSILDKNHSQNLDHRGSYRPGIDRFNQPYNDANSSSHPSPRSSVRIRRSNSLAIPQRGRSNLDPTEEENTEMYEDLIHGIKPGEIIEKGIEIDSIISRLCRPPLLKPMEEMHDKDFISIIKPWKYDETRPDIKPTPMKDLYGDYDYWNEDCVLMPYSKYYQNVNKQPMWSTIIKHLVSFCSKCATRTAKFKDLKAPPLLKIGTNHSFTMSQEQAAALLACAFFCLFPYRSNSSSKKEYESFPNPNFGKLYREGPPNKMEKLRCLLHYFNRVTKKMPNGVITFQRVSLPQARFPRWNELNTELCDLNMTTGRKIEEIKNVLQVDFANKYIGGGVLGGGCVQEEIRFTICPEMIVSLLVCEMMQTNECIFLIGCEQYSKYKGYDNSFQYAGDFQDDTTRDGWGRRWCHAVAIDAIYFREPSEQYDMKIVERELLKAYTGFRPMGQGPEYEFGIATGNWGCGAFNGDRQMKAIIQLMAASVAKRPLIYAAYGDKNFTGRIRMKYETLRAKLTEWKLHKKIIFLFPLVLQVLGK